MKFWASGGRFGIIPMMTSAFTRSDTAGFSTGTLVTLTTDITAGFTSTQISTLTATEAKAPLTAQVNALTTDNPVLSTASLTADLVAGIKRLVVRFPFASGRTSLKAILAGINCFLSSRGNRAIAGMMVELA